MRVNSDTVDRGVPGTYKFRYTCINNAGVAAVPETRTVIVYANKRKPASKPKLTVYGPKVWRLPEDKTKDYNDPGAGCDDPKDGDMCVLP